YFIEALTDRMAQLAYEYFLKIDELGGMVEAVKQGYPQREIADAAFQLQQEIESGRRIVVGVNAYTKDDAELTPILRIDPALEKKQIDRLNAVRARRDISAVEAALASIRQAARHPGENLMPRLIDAARARVSEGEIVGALQAVWGDYREAPAF
ncbi:MAG: methylmalonyl-CoA mutase family protein, partial [Solirubrobacteraceae bacterium]